MVTLTMHLACGLQRPIQTVQAYAEFPNTPNQIPSRPAGPRPSKLSEGGRSNPSEVVPNGTAQAAKEHGEPATADGSDTLQRDTEQISSRVKSGATQGSFGDDTTLNEGAMDLGNVPEDLANESTGQKISSIFSDELYFAEVSEALPASGGVEVSKDEIFVERSVVIPEDTAQVVQNVAKEGSGKVLCGVMRLAEDDAKLPREVLQALSAIETEDGHEFQLKEIRDIYDLL